MIAEEQIPSHPEIISSSIPIGKIIDCIIDSFKANTPYLKDHIKQFTHQQLNEEKLTQEFVALLRRKTADYSFLIGQELKDLYNYSTGRSDFYFYWKDESTTTESFFSVEAKILTDRFPNSRETEYVIGSTNNGGIQRYKIEKHGKGLSQCGMLGFVEKDSFDFWIAKINTWIEELSKPNSSIWNKNESIKEVERNAVSIYLKSVAHRSSSNDIQLHHFWITLIN
jgi:hypothetical protein